MTTPDHIWISPTVVDGLTGRIGTWIDHAEPHRISFVRGAVVLTADELIRLRECLGNTLGADKFDRELIAAALAILDAKGVK